MLLRLLNLQWCLLVGVHFAASARCDFKRVDGRQFTEKEFTNNFLEKEPLVITNLIDKWPAFDRWTKENIATKYGAQKFYSSDVSKNNRFLYDFPDGLTLAEYLNSSATTSWFISRHHSMVKHMLSKQDLLIPEILGSIVKDGPHFSFGQHLQGNIIHKHAQSWFAQVHGSKRWLVYPPHARQPVDGLNARKKEPCSSPPVGGYWQELLICTSNPGEIVYLPSEYMHETCSLGDWNAGVAYIGRAHPPDLVSVYQGDLASLKRKWGSGSTRAENPAFLWVAATQGHLTIAKWLIKQRASVSEDRASSMQPIHVAATSGEVQMIKLLMQHRAELSFGVQPQGFRPIEFALRDNQHVRVIKFLSENGPPIPDHVRAVGMTNCAKNGNAGCLRVLLKHHKNRDTIQGLFKEACTFGRPQVAKYLLALRAEVSKAYDKGMTPACLAAQGGHLEIMDLLVEHGVNPAAQKSCLPIAYAAQEGHYHSVSSLLNSSCQIEVASGSEKCGAVLTNSVKGGHVLVAELLLKSRVGPDKAHHSTKSLVPLAQQQGHTAMVAFLRGEAPKLSLKSHEDEL